MHDAYSTPYRGDREIITLIEQDLKVLARARNYLALHLKYIAPYLGSRLLEIGAGIGNHTAMLLDRRPELVVALENEVILCQAIRQRCGDAVHILNRDLSDLRLISPELVQMRLDTVLAINVIEHIDKDLDCLSTLSDILVSGGRIIIITPAHPILYSRLDRNYGHYRRYTRDIFEGYARALNMKLVENRYLNMFGAFSWLISARIGQATQLNPIGMMLLDYVLPLQDLLERRLPRVPFGLSIMGVFEKG